MRTIRVLVLLAASLAAFAACKKGGGYMHTAPAPAVSQ